LAFRSLLPSALPSFEAVESRFKLLEDGVAPLDPDGVVFKEEAMSLIKRKTRQMALVKSLLVSRKMATAVFLSLALSKLHKMQVQKSGPSCIYLALAGPKSAVGHFPQSEGQPIWDQLV
jgi:hypothetical protein